MNSFLLSRGWDMTETGDGICWNPPNNYTGKRLCFCEEQAVELEVSGGVADYLNSVMDDRIYQERQQLEQQTRLREYEEYIRKGGTPKGVPPNF